MLQNPYLLAVFSRNCLKIQEKSAIGQIIEIFNIFGYFLFHIDFDKFE